MLHGAIINFRRRIVNQTRGFSCRVAAQFNEQHAADGEPAVQSACIRVSAAAGSHR
jgi:hypothetical protein